jgi:secretion/DNA translocation related TadE-like protein
MPHAGGCRLCSWSTSGQDGVATLLTTVWIMVLVVVFSLGMAVCGLWRAQARAGVAADLGALAAAEQLLGGPDAACAAANSVVAANSAVLISCSVVGTDVQVVTAVELPAGFARQALAGRTIAIRNRAHASIERA